MSFSHRGVSFQELLFVVVFAIPQVVVLEILDNKTKLKFKKN